MSFEKTGLWRRTLGGEGQAHEASCERLRVAYRRFRHNVSLLAEEINRELPDYTVHNITHIDALWEVADKIAGASYPINPLEGFVLGGAFLLHDLGMGLASWPGREAKLKAHRRWRGTVASLLQRERHRSPTAEEIAGASKEVQAQAIRELLRLLHAEHAEHLLDTSWQDDEGRRPHVLLEDEPLCFHLGSLIGKIAHSHWWDIDRLSVEFRTAKGAPSDLPSAWAIEPLKIAALLRAADAAHLDERRAPRLLRAARALTGVSRAHWVFQGHMLQVQEKDNRLEFTVARPFPANETEAWWLARESLQMVDRELRTVDALLADKHQPRFAARGVAGVDSLSRLKEYLEVKGWEPVEVRVRVGDVARLVERLGGRELYGNDSTVPLRELIQNASDAVRARRVAEDREPDWGRITVRCGRDETGDWMEVEDNGIGMSTAVLAGPLLDFGETYWGSSLCREENPGLTEKGFEATGRYGIGFFSIFMWGERVQITSQRYDRAKSEARVLEFATGLHTRPVLKDADSGQYLREGGTRVRVWLLENAGRLDRSREDEGETPRQTLENNCRHVAPSLEVDLWVEGEQGLKPVVRAGDWRTIEPHMLFDRLIGTKKWLVQQKGDRLKLEELGTLLRPILNDAGETVGRACIHPWTDHADAVGLSALSAITVGGLRAGGSARLCGVLVGRPTRADRMSAYPVAYGEALARWATEQESLLCQMSMPLDGRLTAAAMIHRLGGNTASLPIAEASAGWLSSKQIQAQFAPLKWALLVLVDGRERHLSWPDGLALVRLALEADIVQDDLESFRRCLLEADQGSDFLESHVLTTTMKRTMDFVEMSPGILRANLQYWPLCIDEFGNETFQARKPDYAGRILRNNIRIGGLANPIVEALATTWGIAPIQIWSGIEPLAEGSIVVRGGRKESARIFLVRRKSP
jgi:Histidine kinase-, DNA gyrase B-, and HSP90-like ATPase